MGLDGSIPDVFRLLLAGRFDLDEGEALASVFQNVDRHESTVRPKRCLVYGCGAGVEGGLSRLDLAVVVPVGMVDEGTAGEMSGRQLGDLSALVKAVLQDDVGFQLGCVGLVNPPPEKPVAL